MMIEVVVVMMRMRIMDDLIVDNLLKKYIKIFFSLFPFYFSHLWLSEFEDNHSSSEDKG